MLFIDWCIRSDQIGSVAQSRRTVCDPMNRSTPGLPVHHQLPEFTETHVHRVSDAIQPSQDTHKFQVYNIMVHHFKGNAPFIVIVKYWLFSLCYTIYLCQFNSVTQSCPTLCDPVNRSMPGLPVHHQLPEFTQTHVHQVSDAIQPSHPLSSPSPLAPNSSQHQSLFQWVNSSHEVAKVLEFQL